MPVQRLVLTSMGKQTLCEKLEDRIYGALINLSLDSSDEKRAKFVASSLMAFGEFAEYEEHKTKV